jgi:hypothetical protein
VATVEKHYAQHSCPFSRPALVNPPAAWHAAVHDSAVTPLGMLTPFPNVRALTESLRVYIIQVYQDHYGDTYLNFAITYVKQPSYVQRPLPDAVLLILCTMTGGAWLL